MYYNVLCIHFVYYVCIYYVCIYYVYYLLCIIMYYVLCIIKYIIFSNANGIFIKVDSTLDLQARLNYFKRFQSFRIQSLITIVLSKNSITKR